jgi:hypothetical protein
VRWWGLAGVSRLRAHGVTQHLVHLQASGPDLRIGNWGWPRGSERPVTAFNRAAIHHRVRGDAIDRGGAIFGDGVDLARWPRRLREASRRRYIRLRRRGRPEVRSASLPVAPLRNGGWGPSASAGPLHQADGAADAAGGLARRGRRLSANMAHGSGTRSRPSRGGRGARRDLPTIPDQPSRSC